MGSNTNATTQIEPEDGAGQIINVGHLINYLKRVTDSRKQHGIRYALDILLTLFILAKLCGQNKPSGIADWVQLRQEYFRAVLKLKHKKLPHHSTYRRILSEVVNGDEFERIIAEYLSQLRRSGQDVLIVIDGKTVRGTIIPEDPVGLHLLAAYLPGEGIVLMQMVVEKEKETEMVVAPKLLSYLDLRNKVVIADAMHTQRQLSLQIVTAGGNFVWIVKDNQPKTREAIELLFAPEKAIPGVGNPPMDFQSATTTEKQVGRVEERTLTVSSMLNDYLDWPHLEQVFKLERRFTYLASGKVEYEVQYGLTSLPAKDASPARLLKIVRSEWGIESGLHYRRDVTYEEDHTRMTKKPMGRAMAIINNLIISLLNSQGFDNHAHARRVLDASTDKALALICRL
jgi:predicted transposase YbfD/YdcC